MPREKGLSSRLDTLLDAIFDVHSDSFALYWEIAAELETAHNAAVQKKIQKKLQTKNEIGTDSALLVACVLHLTGFPAQRILHFLSLYIPGTVTLSQFDLAISAFFIGQPPVPQSLLYDLTQYTYLEKRLLVRKGMEISDRLKDSLSPEVLLYLYLLSLRDDLSNENVQLISLVMKNCFPALEVRTRLGGASLEEYGELARAWKMANSRTFPADVLRGSRVVERPARSFDRDSASFFLDKYFSDEVLAKTQKRAVKPPTEEIRSTSIRAASRPQEAQPADMGRFARPPRKRAPRPPADAAASPTPQASAPVPAQPAAPPSAARPAAPRARPARRPAGPPTGAGTLVAAGTPAGACSLRLLFLIVPVCIAALAVAAVPIQQARAGAAPVVRAEIAVAPTAPAAQPAPVPLSAPSTPAPAPQSAPEVQKYVVRQGDSIWKIFRALGRNANGESWKEFLSTTRSLNGLDDPDTIMPGRVLDLAPQGK